MLNLERTKDRRHVCLTLRSLSLCGAWGVLWIDSPKAVNVAKAT